MMIVAGHQPNYLPYLGFFDKMRRSDIFIIEDNVQFERQGYTNRNRILTAEGVRWLTVPIKHVKKSLLINEVQIANRGKPSWGRKHWLTLKHSYCRTPFWNDFEDFFKETYESEWNLLIDLNLHLIQGIMGFLGINKQLVLGSSLASRGKKSELIVAQCREVGADVQLAGNGCKDYINPELFAEQDIKLVFQEFHHPVYRQNRLRFVPNLSVVDYLFCVGPTSW